MKIKYPKFLRIFLAACLSLFCTLGFSLPALAAEGGVPPVVMQARNAVLRVVCEGEDFLSMGTGFAVGSQKHPYIITNYHVIEDAKKVYLFYDNGKFIPGRIYKEYSDQDLAVIKPLDSIPDIQVLSLADKGVDSGQAVYALGYPGAADILSSGFDSPNVDNVDAFLATVMADKQTMTVTNGIISAIRTSKLIGYAGADVKMVQTNTAINNGNSGGPLLNSAGEVVGINTLGLSGYDTIEAMNGSVHVDELLRLLKRDKVPYTAASGAISTGLAEGQNQRDTTLILVVSACMLVFLAAMVILVVVARKNRKKKPGQEMNLLAWERGGYTMGELEVCQKMMGFLQQLAALEAGGTDVYALLSPENILVGPKGLALHRRKGESGDSGALKLYPGYSAPESYDNRSSPASSVYFLGAVMALLLGGRRPENAMRRKETGAPAFAEQGASSLRRLVNEAMSVREEPRGQGLAGLQYRMARALPAIQAENPPNYGYPGQMPAGAGAYYGQAPGMPPSAGYYGQPPTAPGAPQQAPGGQNQWQPPQPPQYPRG